MCPLRFDPEKCYSKHDLFDIYYLRSTYLKCHNLNTPPGVTEGIGGMVNKWIQASIEHNMVRIGPEWAHHLILIKIMVVSKDLIDPYVVVAKKDKS